MRFGRRRGQGIVEYALILVLAVIVVIASVRVFGLTTSSTVGDVGKTVANSA